MKSPPVKTPLGMTASRIFVPKHDRARFAVFEILCALNDAEAMSLLDQRAKGACRFSTLACTPLDRFGEDAQIVLKNIAITKSTLAAWLEGRGFIEVRSWLLPRPDDASRESGGLSFSVKRHSPAKLEQWYQHEYVPKCIAAGVLPSRDEDWDAAKEKFGSGVPRDAVRELRNCYAPPIWRKRGRRKK